MGETALAPETICTVEWDLWWKGGGSNRLAGDPVFINLNRTTGFFCVPTCAITTIKNKTQTK